VYVVTTLQSGRMWFGIPEKRSSFSRSIRQISLSIHASISDGTGGSFCG